MNPNQFGAPQFGAPAPQQFGAPAPAFGAPVPQFGAPAAPQFQNGPAYGAPPVAGISFAPDTYTEGGLLSDVYVLAQNWRCAMYDYNGKATAAPAVTCDLITLDARTLQPLPGHTPQMQAWSVGSSDDFEPSGDGRMMLPRGTKRAMNKSSNFAMLCTSLVSLGLPVAMLSTGDVTALNGVVGFIQRKEVQGRSNIPGTKKKEGDREASVLVFTELKKLPGGQAAPQAQPQAQPVQMPQQMPAQMPAQMPPPQFGAMAPAPMPQQMPMLPAPAPAPAFQPADATQAAAAQLLNEVMAQSPASRTDFNMKVFQMAGANAAARDMAYNPQFQAAVLGAPVNLA